MSIIQFKSFTFGEQMNLTARASNKFIRPLVKYFEQLSVPSKLRFIRGVNFLLPARAWSEKSWLKRLTSQKVEPAFDFSRDMGAQEISLDPQFSSKAIQFASNRLAEFKEHNLEKKNSKSYLQQIFNSGEVNEESQFLLDFATSLPVLKGVAGYLGAYPILHDISVFYSPPMATQFGTPFTGSQLFHMDGDGAQNVKLWLLCEGVEIENGPTVLIPAFESAQVAEQISYQPGDKIQDAQLGKALMRTVAATGAAGTWYATDTDRCFHYGSRTTTNSQRLVVMFHYVDHNSSYYLPLFRIYYRKVRKMIKASFLEGRGDFAKISLRYRIQKNF